VYIFDFRFRTYHFNCDYDSFNDPLNHEIIGFHDSRECVCVHTTKLKLQQGLQGNLIVYIMMQGISSIKKFV